MSFFVERLTRPYDYRTLIETYIYTRRKNFIHDDFTKYYAALLEALQKCFDVRMDSEGLSIKYRVFWMLFNSTVDSLLRITDPWAGYLEATLLNQKLQQSGEVGESVYQSSRIIRESNAASEAAHRQILETLFRAIFGDCSKIVTSEELRDAGFDDSQEPDISDYYDEL
jgi:hypothetical protein